MSTLTVCSGVYAWTLTLEDGSIARVLASDLASAVAGTVLSPVVGATRGPLFSGGSVTPVPPTLTSLVPSSAALGSPSFTLHVHGTGFRDDSVILWNGSQEPTTLVSPTELTTEVNMATAAVAVPIPVAVVNLPGLTSNPLTFTLTAAAGATTRDADWPAT